MQNKNFTSCCPRWWRTLVWSTEVTLTWSSKCWWFPTGQRLSLSRTDSEHTDTKFESLIHFNHVLSWSVYWHLIPGAFNDLWILFFDNSPENFILVVIYNIYPWIIWQSDLNLILWSIHLHINIECYFFFIPTSILFFDNWNYI